MEASIEEEGDFTNTDCYFEGIDDMFQIETSLLRRLQSQTLPLEAPPVGKIHPFSKIAVTFEPDMQF